MEVNGRASTSVIVPERTEPPVPISVIAVLIMSLFPIVEQMVLDHICVKWMRKKPLFHSKCVIILLP
jgi:hypothetical protein